MERLKLVADDVLTQDEREARNSRRCNTKRIISSAEIETANHLLAVLKRGVQVVDCTIFLCDYFICRNIFKNETKQIRYLSNLHSTAIICCSCHYNFLIIGRIHSFLLCTLLFYLMSINSFHTLLLPMFFVCFRYCNITQEGVFCDHSSCTMNRLTT